jgi:hypothetical protein
MVIMDQYTGRVLYADNSRTAPGDRRMETLNRALHTGDIFRAAKQNHVISREFVSGPAGDDSRHML